VPITSCTVPFSAGANQNEMIGPLAHLGLRRAYALDGDSAKAKTAYQDFLALWKNADPDIPILAKRKLSTQS
jgi:eukaryotic-like serine/threonine-protein kinase